MIDLSNNERPFGLLSPEEQQAMREWPHGVEFYTGNGWRDAVPSWLRSNVYRTKPAPVTYPSVDWSVLVGDITCVTRDAHSSCLWKGAPKFDGVWIGAARALYRGMPSLLASYDPGTCPDSEAISYRPGCEPEGK